MSKQPVVLLLCFGWMPLAAGPAMADTKQGMKPGKKGQVIFSPEARIGDLILKPGEYTVPCVPAVEERAMRFTRTSSRSHPGGAAAADSGNVKSRIELNGESAAHLF
jgi:hypothetical protein